MKSRKNTWTLHLLSLLSLQSRQNAIRIYLYIYVSLEHSDQLLIILYVLSKTEWMNIPKMYATKICNLRLSKTFLKVWCSSKVLFLSNINMKLWKIAFCCVCSSHKHSNNASVWEYLVKFWHYQITYCKSSLHRYLSTYFSKNSSWVLCM